MALFYSLRDAFFSLAMGVLDATDVPITRLTLRLEFVGYGRTVDTFLNLDSGGSPSADRDVFANLLSHHALRRVEELRLAAEEISQVYEDDEITSSSSLEGIITLSLGSLPSETLRVLDITNCKELLPLPPDTAVMFRQLSSLWLRHCTASSSALQSLFDAAPVLASIHLESVVVSEVGTTGSPTKTLLRCPAATVIVLHSCYWKQKDRPGQYQRGQREIIAVEMDAPRLRHFRYKGLLRPFSLSQPLLDLARVDLHFVERQHSRNRRDLDGSILQWPDHESELCYLMNFWRFIKIFANVKELKLRVNALEQIAVRSKVRSLKLLSVLANVHRLEVQGLHRPTGKTAAVAIANLLRCCPSLCDLRINLTAASDREDHFLERNDRDKSIHDLNHYRSSAPTMVSLEGTTGDANYDDVSDILCLIGRSFHCLQRSVKKVTLQFRSEEANCLGVKLIKFFIENAMVLQEMYIDGGNEKLRDHMTRKVERWISCSSINRKPGVSRFVILPLKRL